MTAANSQRVDEVLRNGRQIPEEQLAAIVDIIHASVHTNCTTGCIVVKFAPNGCHEIWLRNKK